MKFIFVQQRCKWNDERGSINVVQKKFQNSVDSFCHDYLSSFAIFEIFHIRKSCKIWRVIAYRLQICSKPFRTPLKKPLPPFLVCLGEGYHDSGTGGIFAFCQQNNASLFDSQLVWWNLGTTLDHSYVSVPGFERQNDGSWYFFSKVGLYYHRSFFWNKNRSKEPRFWGDTKHISYLLNWWRKNSRMGRIEVWVPKSSEFSQVWPIESPRTGVGHQQWYFCRG